jgi:hypothetical protein
MRARTILVFGMKQGIIRADHAFIQGLHMHETLLMILFGTKPRRA